MNITEQLDRTKLFPQLEPLYDSRRFIPIFAGVYFAALLFFGLTFHKVGDFGAETDFYWGYAPQARDFLLGKITIDAFHGPLYPWTLGLFGKVFGDLFRSGIIISALSASLSLLFIFEILKSVFSSDVAFVSTVFVSVNKSFVQYSYTASTDMFFVAVSLAGLLLLFRRPVITVSELCLSAACMSLAYLVRYVGLVFLLVVPFVILLRSVQVRGLTRYSAVVIWVAVFVVFAAPWSIYLKLNRGSFFYDKNYQNIAYEVFSRGRVTWDNFWSKFANQYTGYSDVVFKAPFLFLATLLANAFTHLINDLSRLTNIAIGILSLSGGLFLVFFRPDRKKIGLMIIFISFFVILLLVFYSERFSLFLVPMYMLSFAFFLKAFLAKFGAEKNVRPSLSYIVLALLIISFWDSYSFNSRNISSGPNEMLFVRDCFHEAYHGQYDNAKIVARKPHIAYLLGMQFYPFPMIGNYDSLLAVLRRDDVKFLYYGNLEAGLRPQFLNLLQLDVPHPGLKPLCITGPRLAVLYEVTK
ncbi:MAG TPA: glycosyltransferase family 39 protein [Candidatus Acidoferrales bacterium]|nr:glycosyltransferase family 39 protein [Candidatus Acidoferrales bacterium]